MKRLAAAIVVHDGGGGVSVAKSGDDLTKTEALAELGGLLATCTALVAKGVVNPVLAGSLYLLTKLPAWWGRRARARLEQWWNGFLKESQNQSSTPFEMAQEIAAKINTNEATGEVIFGFVKDVIDTPFEGCVPILGALRGAYYADGSAPDGFFRSFAALLTQCSELDLDGLRALIGRLACVQPDTKSKTVLLDTVYFHNEGSGTGTWRRDVHQLELEVDGGSRRTSVLGTDWVPSTQWRRVDHLLVSNGLARGEGRENLIVHHDDVHRMHKFLRLALAPRGRYRYVSRGSGGSYHAELELIPACFGYGATPDEAADRLHKNLKLFVSDAATAVLEQI